MQLTVYQVDAFVADGLQGNPAGVCITSTPLNSDIMQRIASDVGLSETAFLALDSMQLRWFTPKVEVNLCGHGTLATAHLLHEIGLLTSQDMTFHTLSGELNALIGQHGISLVFPAAELIACQPLDARLLEYLGIAINDVVYSAMFGAKQLIVLDDEQQVLRLSPNFSGLASLVGRGVVVTAKSQHPQFDIVSRYFAPWVGVNEDPVTGSAHCALAVYWRDVLAKPLLHGWQASPQGGAITMKLHDNHQVQLVGQARTIGQGQFEAL